MRGAGDARWSEDSGRLCLFIMAVMGRPVVVAATGAQLLILFGPFSPLPRAIGLRMRKFSLRENVARQRRQPRFAPGSKRKGINIKVG